jgi:hypothetical protein
MSKRRDLVSEPKLRAVSLEPKLANAFNVSTDGTIVFIDFAFIRAEMGKDMSYEWENIDITDIELEQIVTPHTCICTTVSKAATLMRQMADVLSQLAEEIEKNEK